MSMSEHEDTGSPEVTDRELVERAQGGDYGAFDELVTRYQDRVYRLALGLTKNTAEAEEAVQDAFLSMFRNLGSFKGQSALATWIYRITTNAALMRLRTKRRKPLISIEDQSPSHQHGASAIWPKGHWAQQPDEKLLTDELRQHLEDAIAELPESYRVVLLLRDVEGLTNAEVADTVGVTVPTVKARLHRARLAVRAAIEKYHGTRGI